MDASLQASLSPMTCAILLANMLQSLPYKVNIPFSLSPRLQCWKKLSASTVEKLWQKERSGSLICTRNGVAYWHFVLLPCCACPLHSATPRTTMRRGRQSCFGTVKVWSGQFELLQGYIEYCFVHNQPTNHCTILQAADIEELQEGMMEV